MYALHHDADVVNISIGPSFKGLNVLPVEQQAEIAKTQFQNVAFLWARVCKLAAKKNTILVFAAGNDDILTSIPPENRNASSIVVTAVDKRLYPTVQMCIRDSIGMPYVPHTVERKRHTPP